jgi:hypothetical protein
MIGPLLSGTALKHTALQTLHVLKINPHRPAVSKPHTTSMASALNSRSSAGMEDATEMAKRGALSAIALELYVRNLYVSTATANESPVLARDHSSEILAFDTVAAPFIRLVPRAEPLHPEDQNYEHDRRENASQNSNQRDVVHALPMARGASPVEA